MQIRLLPKTGFISHDFNNQTFFTTTEPVMIYETNNTLITYANYYFIQG